MYITTIADSYVQINYSLSLSLSLSSHMIQGEQFQNNHEFGPTIIVDYTGPSLSWFHLAPWSKPMSL